MQALFSSVKNPFREFDMTGAEILAGLNVILTGLVSLSRSEVGRQDRRREAVARLSEAVTTTRAYLRTGWPERNHDLEARLTDSWFRAADAFRGIDPQISERCRLKGHYWTDPEAWSKNEIEEAEISLGDMTIQLDRLLLE